LKSAVKRIPPKYKSVRSTLEVQILHLETYQSSLVEPLINGTTLLLTMANKLNNLLLFKQSSFEKAIKMLIREIDNAERFINEDGTQYIQKAVHLLSESFSRDINGYLDHVINTTRSDVGRCAPISNVYNSTIVNVCNRVVDPFVSLNSSIVSISISKSILFISYRMVSGLVYSSVFFSSSQLLF
jgi:prominin 1